MPSFIHGTATLQVPVHLDHVLLVLTDQETTLKVAVGHMDPLSTRSGVQKRLNNLGYACHLRGNESHDARILQREIRLFQAHEGLTETGILDDNTRTRLRDRHGS